MINIPTLSLVRCLRAVLVILTIFACSEEEFKPSPVATRLIVSTSPQKDKISVFSPIRVVMFSKIEQEITLEGQTFKAVLDEFKILKDSETITGEMLVSPTKDTLTFYSEQLLPEQSSLNIHIKSHWERKDGSQWVMIKDEQGADVYENTESTVLTEAYQPLTSLQYSVYPQNGAVDQDVVMVPTVVLDEGHAVPVVSYGTSYRRVVDSGKLMLGSVEVDSEAEWSEAKNILTITPTALLNSLTTYNVVIDDHWEKKVGENWVELKMNGTNIRETFSSTFTTKEQPIVDVILQANIRAEYPIPYQYNFLKSEYAKGYILLLTGQQDFLFESASYDLKVRISTPGQSAMEVDASYDETSREISYVMPLPLQNETIYQLELLQINKISSVIMTLHSLHFRTSKFNTFSEKMDQYSITNAVEWRTGPSVDELQARLENGTEYFDVAETTMIPAEEPYTGYATGLIQFECLPGSAWYDNNVKQLYDRYDEYGFTISRRDHGLGIPPVNAAFITQSDDFQLTEEQIAANAADPIVPSRCIIFYSLPYFYSVDWFEVRSQAENHPDKETDPFLQGLTGDVYPGIEQQAAYGVKCKYVLPGKGTVTSEKTYEIVYQ